MPGKPAGRWHDHERYTTEQHNKQKVYVESTKHELRLYIWPLEKPIIKFLKNVNGLHKLVFKRILCSLLVNIFNIVAVV